MAQTKNKQLVVVGSVALDTLKTPFGNVKRALGGSAVYFSSAARFFCPVSMVGVAGSDFDKNHISLLKRMKVDLGGLEIVEGKTFHWQGRYEDNLNVAITEKTELNVFANFRPKLSAAQKMSPYLFLANIHPGLQLEVLGQMSGPKWIAMDTMNFWIESAKNDLTKVIRKVDIVLMNDAEIAQYTGQTNLLKAVESVMKLGPKVVVVKRGEYGAVCFYGKDYFSIPAFLLDQLKDPTGAGDSFAGGFLGYLASAGRLSAQEIRQAAVYGSVIASFNVQSFSNKRLAALNKAELNSRCKAFKKRISL